VRIYLTGFMGAGKTKVGCRLAELLAMPFVDLDREIEAAAGMSVRELFARYGEAGFRQRERATLAATLDQESVVVATGGGTLTFPENHELIAGRSLTVWLNPSFDAIVARLGGMKKLDRPLFRDETQAWELYQSRLPAYRRCDLQVDVGRAESADEVAARLALLLRERLSCAS